MSRVSRGSRPGFVGLRTRIVAVVLGTVLPTMAHACAVCFSGSPRVRAAFFNMTIMLSLLPLGMLFGGAWALRRASRSSLKEELIVTDYSVAQEGQEGQAPLKARVAAVELATQAVQPRPETAKRPGAFGPEAIEPS